jgi:hypothetical protein
MWGRLVSYLISLIISLNIFFGIAYLVRGFWEPNLQVVAHAVVPRDDIFQLFHKIPGQPEFNQRNSIKTSIVGSPELQEIPFYLPNTFTFNELRLDLGDNPEQDQIRLEKISIHYGTKTYEVSDSLLDFFPERHQIDSVEGTVFYLNNDAGSHDPFLISRNVSAVFQQLNEQPPVIMISYVVALIVAVSLFIYLFFYVDFRPHARKSSK